jgi:N-acetylmuramoyl-L-alanine amidase
MKLKKKNKQILIILIFTLIIGSASGVVYAKYHEYQNQKQNEIKEQARIKSEKKQAETKKEARLKRKKEQAEALAAKEKIEHVAAEKAAADKAEADKKKAAEDAAKGKAATSLNAKKTSPSSKSIPQVKPVTICIDPGHGGDNNHGAQYGVYEKDETIKIANAMKARLEQFSNVIVVMTRTGDNDLSLKSRADVAAANSADFLISLHLNASSEHNMFGSEVWVPVRGENYAKGHAMGDIIMSQLTALGTYNKGVKTKTYGDSDYYGILKHSSEDNIPSCIVEHFYMDNSNDKGFLNDNNLSAFGYADGTAVAQYFRLTSPITGENFSGYSKKSYDTGFHSQDTTGADSVRVSVNSVDEKSGNISLHMYAHDPESGILFYQYSMDGGITWSDSAQWNGGESDVTVSILASNNHNVVIRAINGYDVIASSGTVTY